LKVASAGALLHSSLEENMKLQSLRPSPSMAVSLLALVIALGTAGYAANTIGSSDIIDESIQSVDIKNGEVKTSDIATNAITAAKVATNSLTSSDLFGAAITGAVSFSGIPNGRCSQATLTVSGAQPGQVVWLATDAPIQNGILLYAQRANSPNHVEADICNFSGGPMDAIENLPVRVITFN
jgi:hypothetical protein